MVKKLITRSVNDVRRKMPYVNQELRQKWDTWLYQAPLFNLPGELSYVITRLVRSYTMGESFSYITCVVVVGTLVLTTIEFIRRMVNPYEDKKIAENGDVY